MSKESLFTKANKAPGRVVCGGIIGLVNWRDAVHQDKLQEKVSVPQPMSVLEAFTAREQARAEKIPSKL